MKLAAAADNADFWAGVMFVAFGVVAVYFSRDYPMGSAMRMGPGYFPHYLGLLLIAMGLVVGFKGLMKPGDRLGVWAFRPILALGLGIIVFGLTIEPFGFIPALSLLILLSTFAARGIRPLEVLLLIAVLVAGAVAVFIYGIGLPYQLFWWY